MAQDDEKLDVRMINLNCCGTCAFSIQNFFFGLQSCTNSDTIAQAQSKGFFILPDGSFPVPMLASCPRYTAGKKIFKNEDGRNKP